MSTSPRPTRDSHLNQVQETLVKIGYDPEAIVFDYDFAVSGNEKPWARVDMAAFSDGVQHDLRTSCVAVQRVTHPAEIHTELRKLLYLAPPVALFLGPDEVEIRPVTTKPNNQTNPSRVPYSSLTNYFNEHARDFHPEALSAAKTQGQQLGLFKFDHNLFDFAYDATQNLLEGGFKTAISDAKRSLHELKQPVTKDVSKVALQILAATILEDKQLLGKEQSSTVGNLLKRSEERYSQYFDNVLLDRVGKETAEIAFETLRRNVTFRSFTNEMLGYLHENTFVDQKLRRELGVSYTPRAIAKRILDRLPIEDIPPANRVVFDGCMGSGNLLLAAFERIAMLLPGGWNRDRRHNYLVQRIHGVDIDRFATLIAGLSLAFMDLPTGGAWNVRTADFLALEPAKLPMTPSILVGHPPIGETRSPQGKRQQQTNLFLNKYLDMLVPKGLLGVILPEAFLEHSRCRDARRRLFEECEILELWHLPEGIFPMLNVATVAVLAKKRPAIPNSPHRPIRIEKVSALPHEKQQFLKGGHPRFSYVQPSAEPWLASQECRVRSSPLKRSLWDSLQVPRRLQDIAQIRSGIIPGSASKLEPYALNPGRPEYIQYPGNLHRPRHDLEPDFASQGAKVLVNAHRVPGSPWRIYVEIDDFGYFSRQWLYCVMLQDQSVTWEELAAVLNSSLANAWVDSHNRGRWIGENTLRELPFPSLTDSMRDSIRNWVTEIRALNQRTLPDSPRHDCDTETIRKLVLSIDDIVCDAFKVDEEGRKALREYFTGHRRPGFEWERAEPSEVEAATVSNGRTWTVTGQVIQTDAELGTLTLWVRGYQDNQPFRIPIPETMPGWALRPEAAFEAEIPWSSRYAEDLPVNELIDFRPLDFSYVEPEELMDLLEDPKKLDELYGV